MSVPAQASATCVLLRDAQATPGLEVLLLQRSSRLSFHGGAWVFPGGRVDLEDAGHDELSRAKSAALRETREEAGLELAALELRTDAHWVTPRGRPKRFRTWFFWAPAPPGRVQVDGGEVLSHRWLTPASALAAHARAELELPPPTFVTLTKLLAFKRIPEAMESLNKRGPEYFTPRPVFTSDGIVSLYEGDAGYASEDVSAPGRRRRLSMPNAGTWRFEDST
ncbi:MAG: NUDIX domain-containing protein [Polyangiaceae bacterium]